MRIDECGGYLKIFFYYLTGPRWALKGTYIDANIQEKHGISSVLQAIVKV